MSDATPDDLAFLRLIATLPSTGTIGERNRLVRCALTLARALRAEGDAAGVALEPALEPERAPAARTAPILGPGDR